MDLKDVIDRIRSSIPRHAKVYAIGRERQVALAPYPTALSALEALRSLSSLGFDERGQLLLAIVNEQQIQPHALWQTMLVCAFAPMLRKLRQRLKNLSRDDREQEIIVCFLEAVKALPPVERPSFNEVALRRATARAAYKAQLAEKRASRTEPFNEETYPADPFSEAMQHGLEDASAAEAARIVADGGMGEELLPVLLATYVSEPRLSDYVTVTFASSSEDVRAREQERLMRARRKLRDRLRSRQDLSY